MAEYVVRWSSEAESWVAFRLDTEYPATPHFKTRREAVERGVNWPTSFPPAVVKVLREDGLLDFELSDLGTRVLVDPDGEVWDVTATDPPLPGAPPPGKQAHWVRLAPRDGGTGRDVQVPESVDLWEATNKELQQLLDEARKERP